MKTLTFTLFSIHLVFFLSYASADTNPLQVVTPPIQADSESYSPEDFTVTEKWEKIFADPDRFSTTNGKELYHTMCQACHMPDGQGAKGAGDYPSFVGNERLRTPDYPISVILNGLRGMPPFSDELSDKQVADVVNYLRTSFGNQLESSATADTVSRMRHE